jgi:hypothetical protein
MTEISRILYSAAQVEAQQRGLCSIPANDNDPPEPPPASAARISASCYQDGSKEMDHYDIEVLKGEETIAAMKSIALPDLRAAWSHVTELARKIDEPGSVIRVTNRVGEIEILAGISIARGDVAGARAATIASLSCSPTPSNRTGPSRQSAWWADRSDRAYP